MERPQLERAPRRPDERAAPPPAFARPLLGAPLGVKLAGASVLVGSVGVGAVLLSQRVGGGRSAAILVAAAACGIALVVSMLLVRFALRPIADLERTAERVSAGDLSARVPLSAIADPELRRVGDTLNRVLDGFVSDRARLRRLASEVIRVGDAERARLARELHDSTAQTLAALKLQLAVLAQKEPAIGPRLMPIVDLAGAALEEVRALAYIAYPRVLDDLGLSAALRWLARQMEDLPNNLEIAVETPDDDPPLSADGRAVLYRVAQEALRNVTRHAAASQVRIVLAEDTGGVSLSVLDDGTGFDVAAAERRRPSMGLFTMRERTSLVDGHLTIESAPGRGTRIVAWVPSGAHAPTDAP